MFCLLDIYLLLHVVLHFFRELVASLELRHLGVFPGDLLSLLPLRSCSLVLLGPDLLLALFDSLSLKLVTLILLREARLLQLSQELAFFRNLVADGAFLLLTSK